MTIQTPASTEPRAPLSRDLVLRAAIDLADAGGIEALSMRRLGQALRVEAMSLYNHVSSKDDLLDGIVDVIVDEFELPAPGADGTTGLRRSAISAHDVLRRHPWAAGLMVTRPTRVGGARLRHMDATLRVMRLAGFSIVLTHHAFHVLDGYIVGFTLQEVGVPVASEEVPAKAADFLQRLPAVEYPHLAEHIAYHIESGTYDEGDFEFGLDLILGGLERLLGGSRGAGRDGGGGGAGGGGAGGPGGSGRDPGRGADGRRADGRRADGRRADGRSARTR